MLPLNFIAASTTPDSEAPSSSSPLPEAIKKDYIKHKVDYLGCLPISSKSTNLASLQRPLKDLYFKYRALRNLGQTNLPGTLEINDTGLTVQYIRELHKGVQELFNPFPTIAVWAAVKFVHRREATPAGSVHHRYAFLPLISEPDGGVDLNRQRLFHDLDFHEVELAADAPHPPIFACVMRRTGVPKQLECHGFVCSNSEDAIIIAANLYQALLETMKKQKAQKKKQQQQSMPELPPPPALFSDSDTPSMPTRPPRKKKKSSAMAKSTGDLTSSGPPSLIGLQRRRSTRGSARSSVRGGGKPTVSYNPSAAISGGGRKFDGGDFSRRSTRKSGRRSKSSANLLSTTSQQQQGDLYTRVAIPRSKSFMNVNSQYNLQELFRELKEKEGVDSIDDVLKKVISPDGISFNEIKPVYRELLMKLAMTMSQDELFQRSKNILSQEKKKQEKNNKGKKKSVPASGNKNKKSKSMSNLNAGSENNSSTLGSFFKLTFSSKNNSLSQTENNKDKEKNSNKRKEFERKPLPSIPTGPNSSRAILTKADISGPIPISGGSRPLPVPTALPVSSRIIQDTKDINDVDDDDTYMSCSECNRNSTATDYESVCAYESCSCRGEKSRPQLPKPYQSGPVIDHLHNNGDNNTISAASTAKRPEKQTLNVEPEIYCDCDGDSCISSEKCYCSLRGDPNKSKIKTRLQIHGGSSSVPPPPPPLPNHNHRHDNNNKTIIHCDGSGRDTIRSSGCCSSILTSSASSSSACSSCICGQSNVSDTTCHSIHRAQTLLSGCESPMTAWRRNSRMVQNQQQQKMMMMTSTRKTSNDSVGYHSNESASSSSSSNSSEGDHCHHCHSSSSGCSSCSSAACSCDSRQQQQQQQQHGHQPRRESKVLMLSTVDKRGKVREINSASF